MAKARGAGTPDLSRLSVNRTSTETVLTQPSAFDNVTVYKAREDRRRHTRDRERDSCKRAEQLQKALDDVRLELDIAKADLEQRVAAERVLNDLMVDLAKILRD